MDKCALLNSIYLPPEVPLGGGGVVGVKTHLAVDNLNMSLVIIAVPSALKKETVFVQTCQTPNC